MIIKDNMNIANKIHPKISTNTNLRPSEAKEIRAEESTNIPKTVDTEINIEKVLESAEIKADDSLLKALSILKKNGVEMNKINIESSAKFIQEQPGSIDSKIISILMTSKKGLPIESLYMGPVHKALNQPNVENNLLNTSGLGQMVNELSSELESIIKEVQLADESIATREKLAAYDDVKPDFNSIKKRILSEPKPDFNILKDKLIEAVNKELPENSKVKASELVKTIDSKETAIKVIDNLESMKINQLKVQISQTSKNIKSDIDVLKTQIDKAMTRGTSEQSPKLIIDTLKNLLSQTPSVAEDLKSQTIEIVEKALSNSLVLEKLNQNSKAMDAIPRSNTIIAKEIESLATAPTNTEKSVQEYERLNTLVDEVKTAIEKTNTIDELKNNLNKLITDSQESTEVKKWIQSAVQKEIESLYKNLEKVESVKSDVQNKSVDLDNAINEISKDFNASKNVSKAVTEIQEKIINNKDLPPQIKEDLESKISNSLSKAEI